MPQRVYGWVPSLPDLRDDEYRFHAPFSVVAALPPSTNNRARFTSPVYDQGQLGSCGSNAACGDIQWDGDQAGQPLQPSRLFGYYVARMVMGTTAYDSGVNNRDMLKAFAKYGWCDESLWQYDIRKFTQKPPVAAFEQASKRLIAVYRNVPQSLDQMRACLAGGDPFIFGFSVYSSFESQAVQQTGNVPMPGRNESFMGGHDVQVVDYDDSRRVFTFRNSYGDHWGDRGFGTIPYDYATNANLSSDFWTIQWKTTPAPVPPTPTPTPVPTTGSFALSVNFNGTTYSGSGTLN